ncbi:DNA-3-methyladenine glycosylase [mine drainage metagenome]|uniref:DNA-3-methyladenine glycosylase n=1 Tax=mine drainage metagenome TaxID=410659 RepID=A0A1J5RH38_9ZZZZ
MIGSSPQPCPSLACSIDLPPAYRARDILAFHGRDAQAVAERVDGNMLRKGLAWRGQPACLTIRFDALRADAMLSVDGAVGAGDADALGMLLHRLLGLAQGIEEFERRYRNHAQLGPLIASQSGLRVPVSASPFEAITWAVTGQQISVGAAVSMRRKLIQVCGLKHSGGLACYPDAGRVAGLSMESLRQAGFSQSKSQTLLTLGRMVSDGQLPLESWTGGALPVEEIRQQLLCIRGIGPWTVNYALLRGFGWLDGSLHGDAAVRRGLQALLQSTEKVTEIEAQRWLAGFSPWRALVAAHLWASNA